MTEHLSLAEKMGADSAFKVGGERELESSSFDLIYETSGAPSGLADAIGLAAPGGRIAALGLPGSDHSVSTTMIVRKELSIVGSMIYTDEFPGVLELLQSGRIDPTPLISDVVGLDEVDNVIKNFNAPDRFKVLVSL